MNETTLKSLKKAIVETVDSSIKKTIDEGLEKKIEEKVSKILASKLKNLLTSKLDDIISSKIDKIVDERIKKTLSKITLTVSTDEKDDLKKMDFASRNKSILEKSKKNAEKARQSIMNEISENREKSSSNMSGVNKISILESLLDDEIDYDDRPESENKTKIKESFASIPVNMAFSNLPKNIKDVLMITAYEVSHNINQPEPGEYDIREGEVEIT